MSKCSMWQNEDGVTLVEFSLSLAILVMVISVVMGVVIAIQKQSRFFHDWGDHSDQLRIAMSQMGEDLTFGRSSNLLSSQEMVIKAYQVRNDEKIKDSTAKTLRWNEKWEGWPKWLSAYEEVQIVYMLEGSSQEYALIRQVQNGANPPDVYSFQVLARDVKEASEFESSGNTVRVVLSTTRQEAGKNEVIQVTSRYDLR